MNLVIALLSTRQFLTAEKIRSMVAGYDESGNVDAFYRMFERDKTELRELGVPLEIGASARYGGQEGYRINRDAYELPEIDLDRDEAAAVAVAARLWESPERVAAGQSALMKLRAGGVQVESELPVSVSAVPSQSRGSEPALGTLLAAIDAGRAVRFSHRTAVNVPPTRRDVEPWVWSPIAGAGTWWGSTGTGRPPEHSGCRASATMWRRTARRTPWASRTASISARPSSGSPRARR